MQAFHSFTAFFVQLICFAPWIIVAVTHFFVGLGWLRLIKGINKLKTQLSLHQVQNAFWPTYARGTHQVNVTV